MKIARIWVASLAVLFLSASAFFFDWNVGVGGGPARYGLSAEVGPTQQVVLWSDGVSAIISEQPVIDGDKVFTTRIYDLGNTQGGTDIVAQNLNTGGFLWRRQLPVDFTSDWRSRVSSAAGGVVYATRAGNTNLSYLYALNALNGNIVWRSQALVDESSSESLSFAANGDLIVGNFSSILRIRKSDGTTAWSMPRTCPTTDGCSAAVFANKAYIWEASGTGPKITAFDLSNGTRLYSSAGVGGGFVQQLAPFVGPDGSVYAPRSQNNPQTDFLVAFTDTGASFLEKWRAPIGYIPFASHAVGPDGSVYTYQTNNTGQNGNEISIVRLDPNNGNILNVSNVLIGDFPAEPRIAIDSAGKVYFTNGGFSRGRFYSLNANLTMRWSVAVPNVNLGGPAIGEDGTVVVSGVGTNVTAYRDPLTEVPPASFSLFRGILLSGGLPELAQSDDMKMVLRPGIVISSLEAPIQLILQGTSPLSNPSVLRFRLEASANQPNIAFQIELYNFQTASYQQMRSGNLTTADTLQRVIIPSPAPFVEMGTNNLRAKISFRATGPVLTYPWTVSIDQAIWKVTP